MTQGITGVAGLKESGALIVSVSWLDCVGQDSTDVTGLKESGVLIVL